MRRLDRADIPWLGRIFSRRYAEFDAGATEAWFVNNILPNPTNYLAIRTDDAFLIAYITNEPWLPNDWHCYVSVLCTDDEKGAGVIWQSMTLLRCARVWAKYRGCVSWRFYTDTPVEIGTLMKRLGAKPLEARYGEFFA